MSDIVSRLRERHSFLCDEAAEEIARLRELLRDIGGFSTHYVKPERRDKWAQNLDLIDAALAGAAVQPTVGPWANIGPGLQECAFCHTTRHVQDQWERATSPAPAAKCACAEYYPELPHHPDCPTRNAAQQPTAPTSGGHDGD